MSPVVGTRNYLTLEGPDSYWELISLDGIWRASPQLIERRGVREYEKFKLNYFDERRVPGDKGISGFTEIPGTPLPAAFKELF
jgi:hypothetical protein